MAPEPNFVDMSFKPFTVNELSSINLEPTGRHKTTQHYLRNTCKFFCGDMMYVKKSFLQRAISI